MRRSAITGLGKFLPERIVPNSELEPLLNTSDAWIRQRTGIEARRWAPPGVGSARLGTQAAQQALAQAGLEPNDIDCLIAATLSPDYEFPGNGVVIQEQLGITNNGPAIDVRAQCSGFLYSLTIADSFIKSGLYRNILLVGSEVHSAGIDLSPRGRDVSVIFGDGGGAAVVQATDDPDRGILTTRLHSEGKFFNKLWIPESCCINTPRLTPRMVEDGTVCPRMDGKFVFMHAVTRMPEVVQEALETLGLKADDIDHLVCHQANLRINEFTAGRLGIPPEKVYNNIQQYGNTTAATIPVCLTELQETGRLRRGDLVMMVAFGAGFTWGAVAMRW